MKKIFALLLVCLLLTACGSQDTIADTTAQAAQQETRAPQTEAATQPPETVPAETEPSPQVGDSIFFGTYEQDNDLENGREPIEWTILDEDETGYFVISTYILDFKKYNEEEAEPEVYWGNCDLRAWLNGEFYEIAFTDAERAQIRLTTVDNSEEKTELGPFTGQSEDTEDYIYLLSDTELQVYYPSTSSFSEFSEARYAYVTTYAYAVGIRVDAVKYERMREETGKVEWFLRSVWDIEYYKEIFGPDTKPEALIVEFDSVPTGTRMIFEGGIRPVMWISK